MKKMAALVTERQMAAAERIIKREGLAFALAASVGKELAATRAMLVEAIAIALSEEFRHGCEMHEDPDVQFKRLRDQAAVK